MTEELQQMQREIVGAVQQELTRFSAEVAASLKQLNEEAATAKTAREALESQVQSLAGALEQANTNNASFQTELQKALEGRLNEFSTATKKRHDEMNTRLGKVVDDANTGITASVAAAAGPILKQMEHRQDQVELEVKNLDGSIRRFDEQAGQMVGHINSVTTAIEARLETITKTVNSANEERLAALVLRVDEVSAAASRQQAEVNNIVGARVDSSEERTNERMLSLETRLTDEIGQRVADIDAHVGRIGVGLDEAVLTLNDRIAGADARFADVEQEFAKVREDLENVDVEAIDEIKEKISSALGQAELVRIEMDRFQETIKENLEATAVRLTEIETTVQDQSMDVETAVQLERLEEVERAVLMLDPDILSSDTGGHSADSAEAEMPIPTPAPEATPAAPAEAAAPAAAAPAEAAAPAAAAPAPAAPEAAPPAVAAVAAVAASAGAAAAATATPIDMPTMPSLGDIQASPAAPLSPPSADPTTPAEDAAAMARPQVNS